MFYGIAAGATWAVETIILGIALSMAPFVSTEQAIFLAPFVSTFIHDAFSALWAALYNGVRGNLKNVYKAAFKTKSGKFVMLAAVIGGPIGMLLSVPIASAAYTLLREATKNRERQQFALQAAGSEKKDP